MQSAPPAIARVRPCQSRLQGTVMPIAIRQLTPVFGAEITQVDLTQPLDDATFAAVENAFETYSVLVFPKQNLNDESQIASSSRFGTLYASHVRDRPEAQGRALLAELLEFATRDAFTYMHHWQVGDLVMYDNRAALHRARPYAITEHARILHRTTVAGEGPTVH